MDNLNPMNSSSEGVPFQERKFDPANAKPSIDPSPKPKKEGFMDVLTGGINVPHHKEVLDEKPETPKASKFLTKGLKTSEFVKAVEKTPSKKINSASRRAAALEVEHQYHNVVREGDVEDHLKDLKKETRTGPTADRRDAQHKIDLLKGFEDNQK